MTRDLGISHGFFYYKQLKPIYYQVIKILANLL